MKTQVNFFKYALFFIAIFALIATGCKKDEEEEEEEETTTTTAFDLLSDYLAAESMDLGDIIKYHGTDGDVKFVVAPPADSASVQAFVDKYYIIDVRSADVYATGHIEGAVNTAYGDVLTEAANAGSKPICVVCYTGQSACFATALLRLSGYPDAQALKWGMTGWSSDFDSWTGNIGDIADGDANWTYDAAPANVKYDDPSISSSATDGASILTERVSTVLADGFKGVSAADVLASPENYFINNYFSETDYLGFGHIDGAYRVNPLLLADETVYNLDPDKMVVTYCYTGQTSAVITAYLRVLGYDAYSLKFGMNGLFNSNSAWASNQWGVDSNSKDLPYVQ
jgi:rhodanese-related sulfurtransferase